MFDGLVEKANNWIKRDYWMGLLPHCHLQAFVAEHISLGTTLPAEASCGDDQMAWPISLLSDNFTSHARDMGIWSCFTIVGAAAMLQIACMDLDYSLQHRCDFSRGRLVILGRV